MWYVWQATYIYYFYKRNINRTQKLRERRQSIIKQFSIFSTLFCMYRSFVFVFFFLVHSNNAFVVKTYTICEKTIFNSVLITALFNEYGFIFLWWLLVEIENINKCLWVVEKHHLFAIQLFTGGLISLTKELVVSATNLISMISWNIKNVKN